MFRLFICIAFICTTFGQESIEDESKFEWVYNVLVRLEALCLNQNLNSQIERQDSKIERQDSKIEQLETKLEDALNTIDELNSTLNSKRSHDSSGSSTYVRWGKTLCPSGAQSVYDGFAAGSHVNFSGNGANLLCLPRNPIWDFYNIKQGPSSIHGVEYKIGGKYQNHEAPCVVCWTPRSSVRMIPARNECPAGWNLEYRGHLASSHESHYRSEYICLDEDPDTVQAEANDWENGVHLYYVESRCGALPCDVYLNHREMTCAVCSFSPP